MKVFEDQETSVKEVLGFHGTNRANPELILNSEEGFDIAFSKRRGLKYGRGIYFAKSFEYSYRTYAFVNGDRSKTLFLAKVQIGNTFEAVDPSKRHSLSSYRTQIKMRR